MLPSVRIVSLIQKPMHPVHKVEMACSLVERTVERLLMTSAGRSGTMYQLAKVADSGSTYLWNDFGGDGI